MNYENIVECLRTCDSDLTADILNTKSGGEFPNIESYADALIDYLAGVNTEINGMKPSEKIGYCNPKAIIDVAYCVSGLLVSLMQFHRYCESSNRFSASEVGNLRDATLQLAMAWDMVLAGDHDDIRGELALEWNATA